MRTVRPSRIGNEDAVDTRPAWRAAVSARVSPELRAVRAEWSAPSRWILIRRLLLPGLVGWSAVPEVVADPWLGPGAFLVVVALLARFTWPAAALLLAVAAVSTPAAGIVAVPVIAYGAGRRIPSLPRASAVFALASVALAVKVLLVNAADGWETAWLLAATSVGLGLILPAAVGALAGERTRRADALRERNALLERAHHLGDEQARMNERARIAGEMHDLLGHRLSLISLHAGALELRTRHTAPDLSEEASVLRTTAKTALDELREVLGILKVDALAPDVDGHGDDAGTRADVSALVLASQRAGVAVQLAWTGEDATWLDGKVRRALHRVVREALTNVHKHAPGAATQVTVERGTQWIRVEVRNALGASGGRPNPGARMGLVGLQERVQLAGGTIRAGTDRERGEFMVSALLPLVASASATAPGGPPDAAASAGQPDRPASRLRR